VLGLEAEQLTELLQPEFELGGLVLAELARAST
jgi:hypothetical protein